MDWQQKAEALDALAEISIKCRRAGDWYVDQRVDVKNGSVLEGRYGNGKTPEAAIEDHWRYVVEETRNTPMYLVARGLDPERRRAVRWNGYMWQDVPEPKRDAA